MDLYEAAAQGQQDQVALLLERKRERKHINDRYVNGETALFVACRNGYFAIADLLLKAGANVNVQADDGSTPLHRACQSCNAELLDMLLSYNASINSAMLDGATPLFVAAAVGFDYGVRKLLEARAAVNQALDMTIERQKSISAMTGHDTIVRSLIAEKMSINNDVSAGMTPLYVASQNGFEGVVRIILDYGADPNQVEMHGLSPVYAVSVCVCVCV
jgi:ankyrin repeat protein